jgi:hypothetical protein
MNTARGSSPQNPPRQNPETDRPMPPLVSPDITVFTYAGAICTGKRIQQ